MKKNSWKSKSNINFLEKDGIGLGVDVIACRNKLMQKGMLTSFTLFDAYHSFVAHAHYLSSGKV